MGVGPHACIVNSMLSIYMVLVYIYGIRILINQDIIVCNMIQVVTNITKLITYNEMKWIDLTQW